MKKITALFLIIVTLSFSLFGCNSSENEKNKDNQNESSGKGEDRFVGVDFDGDGITIGLTSDQKYLSALDTDKKAINDDTIVAAVRDRNEYVKNKLNLSVGYYYMPEPKQGNTKTYDELMTLYNANDGFADAIAYDIVHLIPLMMTGIFRNALTESYSNYFDFEDGSWMHDAMLATTLEEDLSSKVFLLASDYFQSIISETLVIYVNEARAKQAIGNDDAVVALQDTVLEGNWTYDLMASMSSTAFSNTGTNPGAIDKEDLLGTTFDKCDIGSGWGLCWHLSYSADINMITKNSLGYTYSTNLMPLIRLVDKVNNLYTGRGTYLAESDDAARDVFTSGKALFYIGGTLSSLERDDFAFLKCCPLPYPKVNAEDSYVAEVSEHGKLGAILKTGDFTPVSAFWQYSSIMSEKAKIKYYEDGLGLKYETGTNTQKMLNLIYENTKFNRTFFWDMYIQRIICNGAYEAAYCMANSLGRENTVASVWESMINIKCTDLNDTYSKWKEL